MIDPLHYSKLYHECDIKTLSFETTDELEPLTQPIGQGNALEAVDFGASIKQDGYNIFAMGPTGIGKRSSIMNFLNEKADNMPAPRDWCYVNNFKNHHKPVAIKLASGEADKFKDDMDELIEMLKAILPTTFENDNYIKERESINKKFIDKETDIFTFLQDEARKHDVYINATSNNRITFVPTIDGKILSDEEYDSIKGEEKKKINEKMGLFKHIVQEQLKKIKNLNKSRHKELKDLEKKVARESVETLIEELLAKYKDNDKIIEYLNDLQEDVVKNFKDFLAKPEDMNLPAFMQQFYTPSFERYSINILVSHEQDNKAPVIFEDNPIHQNLIGKIEHLSQVGTLVTNFTMIKAGALHKANGGYLVIDAMKLLMKPFAYEELKRALRSKEIRIESLAEQYSFVSTTSLEPEPIPTDLKVVLIGERMLYYLLYHYDPDFKELFKVNADFEDDMPRNDENIILYARMIATIVKKDSLNPLSPEAVKKVVEQSSRDISHISKLSTHLLNLSDLLKEADYYSKKEGSSVIEEEDIQKALHFQKQRRNRIQLKLYELIDENTIMIEVKGAAAGQINALSYIALDGYDFGIPSRVTARTRIGKGEVINIERKVELSGPIHSKGVMIMASYLGSKYAENMPLSLSATLAFEQSYGMIDGDSASSTELYAIISSLSKVPIKQNIAVTGSVNQFGQIQPIGGVNEKIEGFFDICINKDPKGFYGVMIPEANVKHLMLKSEIIEAVKKGSFAVYPVKTIDEGISILTGLDAGSPDAKGEYDPDTVNGKVISKLKEFISIEKKFSDSQKEKGEEEDEISKKPSINKS